MTTVDVDVAVGTAHAWEDLAPPPVLVGEAGGVVTALDGQPLSGAAGTMLAANAALHRQALALVADLPHVRGPKALS